MGKNTNAVIITGDIIASSKFTPVKRKKLQNILNTFIKKITAVTRILKPSNSEETACSLFLQKINRLPCALPFHCIVF